MITIRDKFGRFAKGNQNCLGIPRSEETKRKISLAKKGSWTGSKNPLWKGGKRRKHCLNCGKEYFVRPYAVKRSKFCSRSCRSGYIHRGEKNCNWKGGITKNREKLKHSESYRKWRLKVFQRDRFACRQCGYRSKKSRAHGDKESDIHAHHIIPIEINPKLVLKEGNGITLCKSCHRKTYGKELKFAKVLKEILRDYMRNIPKG